MAVDGGDTWPRPRFYANSNADLEAVTGVPAKRIAKWRLRAELVTHKEAVLCELGNRYFKVQLDMQEALVKTNDWGSDERLEVLQKGHTEMGYYRGLIEWIRIAID